MNAFYEPFAHAPKKVELYIPHPLWNALPIVQLASIPIREIRRLGMDTSPDYPRGGRSEMDWHLGGWSRGMTWPASKQFLAILQLCWHCLAGREYCFKYSDRLVRHVYEALHPHSVGL